MHGWRRSTWGDEISLEYGKGLRGYDAGTGAIRVYGTNGPVGWTDLPLALGPESSSGGRALIGASTTPAIRSL
jgi:type I restriction enzyme S subunit